MGQTLPGGGLPETHSGSVEQVDAPQRTSEVLHGPPVPVGNNSNVSKELSSANFKCSVQPSGVINHQAYCANQASVAQLRKKIKSSVQLLSFYT